MSYTAIIGIFSIILGFLFFVIEIMTKIKDAIEITKSLSELMLQKEKKENEKIKIFLENEENGDTIMLPYLPRRKNLTRGELGGICGMFAGGRRYNLPEISKIFYSGSFDKVFEGGQDMLTILCSEKEFLEFQKTILELNLNF